VRLLHLHYVITAKRYDVIIAAKLYHLPEPLYLTPYYYKAWPPSCCTVGLPDLLHGLLHSHSSCNASSDWQSRWPHLHKKCIQLTRLSGCVILLMIKPKLKEYMHNINPIF
jgi:hypothetical protein